MMVACVLLTASAAFGQMRTRSDAMWARNALSPITVDGVLNEAVWAQAESVFIKFATSAGDPGSAWFWENGTPRPGLDTTRATVKFLVRNDTLYVGVVCRDSSVGGGPFNEFDGILANIRQRQQTARPVGAGELFYGWVKEGWADTLADRPGRRPFFGGPWGHSPYLAARPDSLRAIWDAVTTVQGTQNNDTTIDQSWTTEFKINLRYFGYNVTQVPGDIVMYSLSIYDADWKWPVSITRQSGNRVWYQCPWGNAAAFGHVRLHARPDVTTGSGAAPVIPTEVTIPGSTYPRPTIDGRLTEAIWNNSGVGTLRIKYGDAAIRNAYPSTAPYRSGQFQPTVNGGQAAVTDPSETVVKYFYQGDSLYFGFNVADRVVQSHPSFGQDRWDGLRVIINDRGTRNGDNVLWPRVLTFIVSPTGTAERKDALAPSSGSWDSAGTKVQVALALKGGTTVDTTGTTPDSGYTAEMVVNLRQLGYPAGRGDGIVFMSALMFDGDSYPVATNSYGTRTWFMREGDFPDGAAWSWMNPAVVLAVDEQGNEIPAEFTLLGNYPNPFNPSTTIKFVMPQRSDVSLEVFDVLGRLVSTQNLGVRQAGTHEVRFDASSLASGMYQYRLTMTETQKSVVGKMMLVK
jgi:hypothetical protein